MSLASRVPTQEAGYSMNSPLLFKFLEQLPEDGRYEFLDSTPANQGQLDFFHRFHCKLYLPGCHHQLCELNSEVLDTPTKRHRALVKTLGLYKNSKAALDMILLWDLPNYLDKPILSALVEFLLPHLKRQTVMHCYIHTRQSMPAQAGNFRFQNDKIDVEYPTGQSACPAYYQEVLHKLMKPFTVQRSILLSNGLQEYILHSV